MKDRWYALLQKLDEMVARLCMRRGTRVFLFHHIDDGRARTAVKKHISLTTEEFILWLENCLANGIEFRPLSQIKQYTKANDAFISFDDIFSSAYETAIPILEAKNIPYTCFIATSYLHRDGYASSAVVGRLSQSPLCEIGSHTVGHPKLRTLSAGDASVEIREGKRQLEEIIGQKVSLFAYPYGTLSTCSPRDRLLVGEAGFSYGFSTYSKRVSPKAVLRKPYWIARISISGDNWKSHTTV